MRGLAFLLAAFMTRDLGVNLAGVEFVLNMREKMERLQSQVEEFVEFMNAEMERMRDQNMQQRFRNALVRVGPQRTVSSSPPDNK